ncbi:ABC transporter substrate-binding protein [Nocardia sp. NPDC050793]|uniref:ABC transporter substrate-binding protein n=1 Tax=Nocardia sp. NPDC050793 TaxID=3155159 RepID=UPI0033CCEB72
MAHRCRSIPGSAELARWEALKNGSAQQLSGLRVIDDRRFEVTLTAPFSAFATQLGYAAFFPLPRSFFADRAGFEAHPIGNGPFRFVSHTPGENIVVRRYDAYGGARKPHIEGVEFRFYKALEDAYADVVANDLDYLDFVPADALAGGRYKFRTLINDRRMSTIFRSGWVADYPSIENFLNPIFRTGAAVNGTTYSNPEVDALLASADAAPTEREGWVLYQQAERRILQDMPAIPLWFQKVQSGWSNRTREVAVSQLLQLDLFAVEVD